MAVIPLSFIHDEDVHKGYMITYNDETGKYQVSVKNDSGTSFSADFKSVEEAQTFADDWISK